MHRKPSTFYILMCSPYALAKAYDSHGYEYPISGDALTLLTQDVKP